VCGAAQHVDLVAGADVALVYDAQVGARSARRGEALEKARIAHPQTELEARQTRLRDLQHGAPHGPPLADHRVRDGKPAHRQVLAEGAGAQRGCELCLPPLGVLGRVGVDGLVGPAVHGPIGLVVTAQVHAAQRDPPVDRALPDRRPDGVAVDLHRARLAHVHRLDAACDGTPARAHRPILSVSARKRESSGLCRPGPDLRRRRPDPPGRVS
jgi:hypothetical protein